MKQLLIIFAMAAIMTSCSSKQAETIVTKEDVEIGGNAFSSFSLAGDVNFFLKQDPDAPSKYSLQATAPIKKESENKIKALAIELIPTDEKGTKVREGFSLFAEDLENLLPVYNSSKDVEKVVVFSVDSAGKRDFSKKEAEELIRKIYGVNINFNFIAPPVSQESEAIEKQIADSEKRENIKPRTIDDLCRKYGVYGLLSQYDAALKAGNKSKAKTIEDRLWKIETMVKNDRSLPESLRDGFKDYVEKREDQIEDKY